MSQESNTSKQSGTHASSLERLVLDWIDESDRWKRAKSGLYNTEIMERYNGYSIAYRRCAEELEHLILYQNSVARCHSDENTKTTTI